MGGWMMPPLLRSPSPFSHRLIISILIISACLRPSIAPVPEDKSSSYYTHNLSPSLSSIKPAHPVHASPISADHSHSHSYVPPELILNETALLLSHQPSPLSYLSYDRKLVIADASTGALARSPCAIKTYPAWLLIHAVGMILAWFVALPLVLVTCKSKKPWLNTIFRMTFVVFLALSLISGSIYRSFTPKLYEGEKHSILGWVLVWFGLIFSISDFVTVWYNFKNHLSPKGIFGYYSVSIADDHSENDLESSSLSSTYFSETSYGIKEKKISPWREQFFGHCKYFSERFLVILASVATVHGSVIYTGSCRAEYINGCLAHFIKGGIFFWYGILNWMRYLECFPELGWSWYRSEDKVKSSPSAEMIESFVIFFYGITNVWMERFGVEPGDPYTVKQIQHISIAAMFAFGGLVGVLLESRGVRSLLFGPQETPTSNPFPALCITITGLAMSAHHQEYQFQVAIHKLWGVLLGLFGVMRWATYAMASKRKGPPITEALGSLFLISGGTVFMESVEEVTFSAMRHHFDDMMAFLNVTIAFACLVMAWTVILITVKRKIG